MLVSILWWAVFLPFLPHYNTYVYSWSKTAQCELYNIIECSGFEALTVRFPRFLTRQLRLAVLPTRAVTFFEAVMSKNGPRSSGIECPSGSSISRWSPKSSTWFLVGTALYIWLTDDPAKIKKISINFLWKVMMKIRHLFVL